MRCSSPLLSPLNYSTQQGAIARECPPSDAPRCLRIRRPELPPDPEDVEAAGHVAGVDVPLVLLGGPGVRPRHHAPALGVAPRRLRIFSYPVAIARRAGEVNVPGACPVPRSGEPPVAERRDAVVARLDRAWSRGAVAAKAEYVHRAPAL